MIRGEKFFGDSLRERVYPPQPDPSITTRSFWSSDRARVADISDCVARHLRVLCNATEGGNTERRDWAARGVRRAWRCKGSIARDDQGLMAGIAIYVSDLED